MFRPGAQGRKAQNERLVEPAGVRGSCYPAGGRGGVADMAGDAVDTAGDAADMARHSGKALNVSGASLDDGAQVIQWPYSANSLTNDEWEITNIP